jgi:hypothetical protein
MGKGSRTMYQFFKVKVSVKNRRRKKKLNGQCYISSLGGYPCVATYPRPRFGARSDHVEVRYQPSTKGQPPPVGRSLGPVGRRRQKTPAEVPKSVGRGTTGRGKKLNGQCYISSLGGYLATYPSRPRCRARARTRSEHVAGRYQPSTKGQPPPVGRSLGPVGRRRQKTPAEVPKSVGRGTTGRGKKLNGQCYISSLGV